MQCENRRTYDERDKLDDGVFDCVIVADREFDAAAVAVFENVSVRDFEGVCDELTVDSAVTLDDGLFELDPDDELDDVMVAVSVIADEGEAVEESVVVLVTVEERESEADTDALELCDAEAEGDCVAVPVDDRVAVFELVVVACAVPVRVDDCVLAAVVDGVRDDVEADVRVLQQ